MPSLAKSLVAGALAKVRYVVGHATADGKGKALQSFASKKEAQDFIQSYTGKEKLQIIAYTRKGVGDSGESVARKETPNFKRVDDY